MLELLRIEELRPEVVTAAMTVAMVALYEVLRRSHMLTLAAFLAFPLAMLPKWASDKDAPFCWFQWAKIASVLFAAYLFTAIRRFHLEGYTVARVMSVGILAVNIMEAVVHDTNTGHFFNAAAGVLLILAQPSHNNVSVAKTSPHSLVWEVPNVWVFAYWLWNWTFCAGLSLYRSHLNGFALNTAAVIAGCVLGRNRWLEARTFTLAMWMILAFESGKGLLSISWPAYEAFLNVEYMGMASCAVCALALVQRVVNHFAKKGNKVPEPAPVAAVKAKPKPKAKDN